MDFFQFSSEIFVICIISCIVMYFSFSHFLISKEPFCRVSLNLTDDHRLCDPSKPRLISHVCDGDQSGLDNDINYLSPVAWLLSFSLNHLYLFLSFPLPLSLSLFPSLSLFLFLRYPGKHRSDSDGARKYSTSWMLSG